MIQCEGNPNASRSARTPRNSSNENPVKFPFSITPLEPFMNQCLLRDFTGEKDEFVQVGSKRYLFPGTFKEHAEHFYNFQARSDDIWIATFPRSGTTWTQELVWMIANDLDYETAQRKPLTERFPFLEFCVFMHEKTKETFLQEQKNNPHNQEMIKTISVPGYESIPNIESKRFIKTHLPFSLLPPSVMNEQAKVVYVARNPKDVIVSYYHFQRLDRVLGYVGDFEQFWNYFENDLVISAPYWEHIKEGYAHRHEPNVLFMYYEDMNRDLPSTIRKVAKFLDKIMTEEQVMKLADHLNIENFRNNPAVNFKILFEMGLFVPGEQSFIRNGKSTLEGWPKEYTEEIAHRVEKWIEKNLANTTLRFPQ